METESRGITRGIAEPFLTDRLAVTKKHPKFFPFSFRIVRENEIVCCNQHKITRMGVFFIFDKHFGHLTTFEL